LDRDGTLNVDPGYLADPDKLRLIDGVGEALSRLKALGYKLAVVSNQSGVSRGLIVADQIPRINARLNELLEPFSVRIEHFEMCFLMPDDPASRRKPKPDLIQAAARALDVDISRSFMVGDKASDVRAGRAAGCLGSALVLTGNGAHARRQLSMGEADFIGADLTEVSRWIEAKTASS
jgi:histidinol-phosphate phosphatase family protein